MTEFAALARRAVLVERFETIVRDQHQAMLLLQNAKCNRLVLQMMAVVDALKAMEGDQRRALLPLLQSNDLWIRYRAAQAVLALEPDVARRAIQSVQETGIQPEAGEAASTLGHLDSGRFVPT